MKENNIEERFVVFIMAPWVLISFNQTVVGICLPSLLATACSIVRRFLLPQTRKGKPARKLPAIDSANGDWTKSAGTGSYTIEKPPAITTMSIKAIIVEDQPLS